MAYGVRVRDELLLGRRVRRLRRAVRLEVRSRLGVDRHRQRTGRLAARVGGAGPPDASHDAACPVADDARLLRDALRLRGPQGRRLDNRVRVPHPVHGGSLHGDIEALRTRIRGGDPVRVLGRHDGGPHGRLRDTRRIQGDCDQRLHTGRRDAVRHLRGRVPRRVPPGRTRRGGRQARRGFAERGRSREPRQGALRELQARRLRVLVRSRSAEPSRRRRPHLAWNVGAPADGLEVLLDNRRVRDTSRHDHLHALRGRRRGRTSSADSAGSTSTQRSIPRRGASRSTR